MDIKFVFGVILAVAAILLVGTLAVMFFNWLLIVAFGPAVIKLTFFQAFVVNLVLGFISGYFSRTKSGS